MTFKLTLTLPEARALLQIINEGRGGLMTDEAAANAYLGGKAGIRAAERACYKFDMELSRATKEHVMARHPNLNEMEQ